MTINSFNIVLYTVSFIVPGFISYSVVGLLVPLRKQSDKISFLIYLALSSFNYLCWWWLIYRSINEDWLNENLTLTVPISLLLLVISPTCLGVIIGAVYQKNWIQKTFIKMGLTCIDPIPTAWEWVFDKKDCQWAIVTMKSGNVFHGVYRYASSDTSQRDVYLEQVYSVDKNGKWIKTPDTAGVLISAGEIESIEFIKPRR